jgi:hypothetical protein
MTDKSIFTREQRWQIYGRAADRMREARQRIPEITFACHAINSAIVDVTGKDYGSDAVNRTNFPEFCLFDDVTGTEHETNVWLGLYEWNPGTKKGNELRETVLLLCMEMCG